MLGSECFILRDVLEIEPSARNTTTNSTPVPDGGRRNDTTAEMILTNTLTHGFKIEGTNMVGDKSVDGFNISIPGSVIIAPRFDLEHSTNRRHGWAIAIDGSSHSVSINNTLLLNRVRKMESNVIN
jgi:hypothetical protein